MAAWHWRPCTGLNNVLVLPRSNCSSTCDARLALPFPDSSLAGTTAPSLHRKHDPWYWQWRRWREHGLGMHLRQHLHCLLICMGCGCAITINIHRLWFDLIALARYKQKPWVCVCVCPWCPCSRHSPFPRFPHCHDEKRLFKVPAQFLACVVAALVLWWDTSQFRRLLNAWVWVWPSSPPSRGLAFNRDWWRWCVTLLISKELSLDQLIGTCTSLGLTNGAMQRGNPHS